MKDRIIAVVITFQSAQLCRRFDVFTFEINSAISQTDVLSYTSVWNNMWPQPGIRVQCVNPTALVCLTC